VSTAESVEDLQTRVKTLEDAEREVPEDFETLAGDTAPIVVDEEGFAGEEESYMRSDCRPGLALDVDEEAIPRFIGPLEFTAKGLRVMVASEVASGGADPGTREATDLTVSTVEVVPNGGLQVRIADVDYGYVSSSYQELLALAKSTHVNKSGLVLPLRSGATVGCLKGHADGLYVNTGDGLEIASNTLKVLLATDPCLEFSSGGLRLKLGSAGDILYCNGSKWLSLAKDAGKYLKSGASAVSWDTPSSGISAGTTELESDYTYTTGIETVIDSGAHSAGTYLVSAQGQADVSMAFLITTDENTPPTEQLSYASAAAGKTASCALLTVDLAANEHVYLRCSGSAGTVAGGSTNGGMSTYLTVVKIS
jgi:hypothetical protein